MSKPSQNKLKTIKIRGQSLVKSRKMADCRFLVGSSPNQCEFNGHRSILAGASLVFDRMFYGSLPENNGTISIPDAQPKAFEAMLVYIYTKRISCSSSDFAIELCYLAEKYMLDHLVKYCLDFLLKYLNPTNACQSYEHATLFRDENLLRRSMDLIVNNTWEVIADPSFLDIKDSTLMLILDQNRLNIDSEMDLFNCLLKFANKYGVWNDVANEVVVENDASASLNLGEMAALAMDALSILKDSYDNILESVIESNLLNDFVFDNDKTYGGKPNVSNGVVVVKSDTPVAIIIDILSKINAVNNSVIDFAIEKGILIDIGSDNAGTCGSNEVVVVENDASASGNTGESAEDIINIMNKAVLLQAVKKIRFLTMTPKQFTEGPGRSKLLRQNEASVILTNILSRYNKSKNNSCPMPEGFSQSIKRYRTCYDHMDNYIIRAHQYATFPILSSGLSLIVDTCIYLLAVQIQICGSFSKDFERITAHIYDKDYEEIACSSSIQNKDGTILEYSFNRPVLIESYENYKINLRHKSPLSITTVLSKWAPECHCNGVNFNIEMGHIRPENLDLCTSINGIVFSQKKKYLQCNSIKYY